MNKIDRKLVDVDGFIAILDVAGGNMKELSHFAKRSDTYYWYRLRDRRKLTIGDVYLLEQYLDKKFGKGTFQDAFLRIIEGDGNVKQKNEVEELKKSIEEIKQHIGSTKNKKLKTQSTNILGEK